MILVRALLVWPLLVLTACGGPDRLVGPTPPATATATPTDASDLAALLPADAPEGYSVVAEQSGLLTLDEAAADADDPEAERGRLVENGFLRGYARTWENGTGDVIVLIVDEFATPAGAQKEFEDSLAEAGEAGASRFEVPDIAGAAGLTQPEAEGDVFHAVAFVRDRRLYVAAVGGAAPETAESVGLAKRIIGLL